MITYTLLQQYWWLIVSLLGALVVFLMFVQGANTQIFTLGRTEDERALIVNSTGRKWEFTFTTLVTFGGAFFASVGTFFHGANFVVNKDVMGEQLAPAISSWTTGWHGLEAVANPWNLVLGLVVLFLARILGSLYMLNNIDDEALSPRLRRQVLIDAVPFLVLFLAFAAHLLTADGFAVNPETGIVSIEAYKYLHNFLALPLTLVLFLLGVVLVLLGIGRTVFTTTRRGIWCAGIGSVFTVWALLQVAALNNTAYYPSLADLQSSLTLANSCSSEFTLTTMSFVSLVIPFVLAYIVYAWYSIDRKSLTQSELADNEHMY